jgi:hypothetical protein
MKIKRKNDLMMNFQNSSIWMRKEMASGSDIPLIDVACYGDSST